MTEASLETERASVPNCLHSHPLFHSCSALCWWAVSSDASGLDLPGSCLPPPDGTWPVGTVVEVRVFLPTSVLLPPAFLAVARMREPLIYVSSSTGILCSLLPPFVPLSPGVVKISLFAGPCLVISPFFDSFPQTYHTCVK